LEQGGEDQKDQREEIEQENANPGMQDINQNFMLEKET
jgi:hypothetical protein